MSKVGHLPKTVPSREIPFQFKGTGSTTDDKYEGSFTVKVPGVREVSQQGVELARINGGVPQESLDYITATLNNALASLSVYLIDAPEWFTKDMESGMETLDYNIPIEIFKQADQAISDWRQSLKGELKDEGKKSKKA